MAHIRQTVRRQRRGVQRVKLSCLRIKVLGHPSECFELILQILLTQWFGNLPHWVRNLRSGVHGLRDALLGHPGAGFPAPCALQSQAADGIARGMRGGA